MKTFYSDAQVISSLYVGKKWFNPQISFRLLNLNEPQILATRKAIGQWDELIAPSFVEYSGGVTDVEVLNGYEAAYAHAYYPGPNPIDGSVVLNGYVYGESTGENNLAAPALGQWGYLTLIHELGHAIGLKHPGAYDAYTGANPSTYEAHANHFQDSIQYSVMSYFYAEYTGAQWNNVRPQTPMINDILAIQSVYGADLTTRAGNTVYGFNSSGVDPSIFDFSFNRNPVIAIYDAGGIDTLDVSGWFTSSNIDLNPGTYSDANGMLKNISIARNTVIENVISGMGADTITGNSASNMVRAGFGNDSILGNRGNDTLMGEAGNDYVSGGMGDDSVLGGEGDDILFGSSGNDSVFGELGNDVLSGSTGLDMLSGGEGDDRLLGGDDNDTLFGGSGNDNLRGDAGNDSVLAGDGNDTLLGGDGVDRLYGGSGNDSLRGDAGNDLLYGESGSDILRGGLGNDKLYGGSWVDSLYGDEGNDFLYGGDSNDLLRGGNGNDRVYGEAGIDALYGDGGNDLLSGGEGNDLIRGGDGSDTLYGGAGNDKLNGDAGRDILYGGSGQDIFYLSGPSMSSEADLIRDFRAGDKLGLSFVKQAMSYKGTDILADQIVSFGASIAYELSSTGEMLTKIFADINGASLGGHIMIAEIVHLPTFNLSATDFIV